METRQEGANTSLTTKVNAFSRLMAPKAAMQDQDAVSLPMPKSDNNQGEINTKKARGRPKKQKMEEDEIKLEEDMNTKKRRRPKKDEIENEIPKKNEMKDEGDGTNRRKSERIRNKKDLMDSDLVMLEAESR